MSPDPVPIHIPPGTKVRVFMRYKLMIAEEQRKLTIPKRSRGTTVESLTGDKKGYSLVALDRFSGKMFPLHNRMLEVIK